MKFSQKATIFGVALFLGGLPSAAWADGNFSHTCYDTYVSDSVLTSTCYEVDGYTPNTSSIDLNPYIGNIDGVLLYDYDNFIATCYDVTVTDGSILTATCYEVDGYTPNTSSVDLDIIIENIDGVLTLAE